MRFTKNQKTLFMEAGLWSVFNACTITYLVAFALELGASNTVIGLIGAIPFLSLIIAEIPAAKLVEFFPRRIIVLITSGLSRLMWFLIILSPIIFKEPLFWVIAFYILSRFSGFLANPGFWSMLGDLIPRKIRGEFLSRRMRIIGFIGMIFSALVGIFLKQFPKGDLTGFFIVFAFGIVAGVAGSFQFLRIKEPKYVDTEHHTLKEFFTLNPLLKKFVLIVFFFNFSYMLASPLIAVYILKNLNVSYGLYGFVVAAATFTRIAFATHFGKIIDKFGSRNIAVLSVFATCFIPLFLLFVSPDNIFWLFPIMFLSGASWLGVDLGKLNMLLDFADKKKRAIQIAEYNFFVSIPLVIAPIVGGLIADNVVFFLSGIPLVFAISFVLRAISTLFFMFLPEKHTKVDPSLGMVFREMVAPHLLKKK